MKKITAFQLSDGTIVETEEKAILLQKEIDIKSKLNYLCNEFLSGLKTDELANEIYLKREEFLKALNNQ